MGKKRLKNKQKPKDNHFPTGGQGGLSDDPDRLIRGIGRYVETQRSKKFNSCLIQLKSQGFGEASGR